MENNEKISETQTQKFIEAAGRKFILVGTAHVSRASIEEVKTVIEQNKPDCVAVELDEARYKNMKDPEAFLKMDIIKVLKKKMGFMMLANIVLANYQKKMGETSGVKPGDEMLAAVNKAEELSLPVSLVDRPIATTLRRAWAKNSFFGKIKLLSVLLGSAFSKEDDVTPDEIEKLKVSSEMDSMMNELSDYLPVVKEVLIDERDKYLASKIWESKGENVLAVLGAGHLPGVEAHLKKIAAEQESSDCSGIDFVPKKGIGSKIAMWSIPLIIVALIAAGFVWGGKEAGTKGLTSWVIWNGGLAGIGAVLALANPLTIIVSVLSAPLTSLCPFVGVGFVAGIVQALVCKPKVRDMENLQKDSSTFKGFYRNRILKVLVVLFLTSIGSSIGTFAGGAALLAGVTEFFDKIITWVKSMF